MRKIPFSSQIQSCKECKISTACALYEAPPTTQTNCSFMPPLVPLKSNFMLLHSLQAAGKLIFLDKKHHLMVTKVAQAFVNTACGTGMTRGW